MPESARLSPSYHSSLRSHLAELEYDDYADEPFALQPGDRIGGRPKSRRWRKVVGFILLLAIGGGGTMVALDERAQPYVKQGQELIKEWVELLTTAPQPKAEAGKLAQPEVPDLASRTVAPVREAGEPMQQAAVMTPAAPADGDKETPQEEEKLEPLPPPSVDKSDPLQVKAVAAGLHPGLSRALLEKLTAEDFRNAALAIKTALIETPERGIYIFPSKPAGGLAQFQVKFVRGAGAPCRRYVVGIAKDAWVTTALPMENCEGRRAPAR